MHRCRSHLKLDTKAFRNIVVLTGAGISAGSVLRTYRGADGLWNEMDPESFSTLEGFKRDPLRVWRFYSDVRDAVLAAEPNAAHRSLAKMPLAAGASLTLITQNVDALHQRAGSVEVVELHGTACRTKCSNAACRLVPFEDTSVHRKEVPLCRQCGSPLRPDVTFFGEMLPMHAAMRAKRALRDCDLFLAIGTSGTVSPASEYVRSADYVGAKTLYINLEPLATPNRYFHQSVLGRAEDVLSSMLGG